MYTNIYIERGEQGDTVHLWDDVEGYKTFRWSQFNYAYKPDKHGTHTSMTGIRVSKTRRFRRDDPSLFESDLPRELRVLSDLYLHSDEPSTGHKVMLFDVEVSMENGIPRPNNPVGEITSIAYHDSTTDSYHVLVLDTGEAARTPMELSGATVTFYASELDLLYAFLDQYEQIAPTIISGWNSDHFDVPYLYNRLLQECGEQTANRLSPVGIVRYSEHRGKYVIAGVSSLDYLDIYKKFTYTELPNYRLDTVGRKELGMGKVSYDGSLDELYQADLGKFIEYNLQDVRILVLLDQKLKLMDLIRGICHIGHVPYEDYCYSSKFLEGTIVTYLHRKGVVVVNKAPDAREMMNQRAEDDEEGFEGAYVKPPVPGFYEWVYSLDLNSLYPSIIMSLNISPEKKVGRLVQWDVRQYQSGVQTEFALKMEGTSKVYTLDRQQFVEYMRTENLTISSSGILYENKTKGIIPTVLDIWFRERSEYKELHEKYAKEGNQKLAEYYDRRQHIQKIFLNSLYGVLGLPIFRFFDIDNALSVTATGQDVIKESAEFANRLYNKKLGTDKDYCVYVDTDSLYLLADPLRPAGADPLEFSVKLANAMQSSLNNFYDEFAKEWFFCDTHRFRIKGEAVCSTAIWIAKKRYVLNKLYDLEKNKIKKEDDRLTPRGLDVVRSTFPPMFRDFMNGFMKKLLDKAPKKELDADIVALRQKVLVTPYIDIARNIGIKDIEKYNGEDLTVATFESGTPIHVKAAIGHNSLLELWGLDAKYPPIKNGDKIKYVYLKKNPYRLNAIAFFGYEDAPKITQFIQDNFDAKELFVREMQKKLQAFYTALGWGSIPTESAIDLSDFFD